MRGGIACARRRRQRGYHFASQLCLSVAAGTFINFHRGGRMQLGGRHATRTARMKEKKRTRHDVRLRTDSELSTRTSPLCRWRQAASSAIMPRRLVRSDTKTRGGVLTLHKTFFHCLLFCIICPSHALVNIDQPVSPKSPLYTRVMHTHENRNLRTQRPSS